MKKYVLGFAFDKMGRVALIEKKRPEWQRGKLNGLGGSVEKGEGYHEAMVREFREECGLATLEKDWTPFTVMHGDGWDVTCFASRIDFTGIRSPEEEQVGIWDVKNIPADKCIVNLDFLIPIAIYFLDHDDIQPIDLKYQ
jgi:8-oxo-dGTP diphosphatase